MASSGRGVLLGVTVSSLDAVRFGEAPGLETFQFRPSVQVRDKNVTAAAPGSAQGLCLIVSNIAVAHDELLARGVKISEVFHDAGGVNAGPDEPYLFGRLRVSGPDPEHRSHRSFASFSDPNGNGWLFQEITTRLAGRVDPATTTFASANGLASALRRAAAAHGQHEARTGQADELARLVRRVHGVRAGRPRAAEMNDYDATVLSYSENKEGVSAVGRRSSSSVVFCQFGRLVHDGVDNGALFGI